MSNPKLLAFHRKIAKFLKKFFLFERRNEIADSKYRVAAPRQQWPTAKKRTQAAPKGLLKKKIFSPDNKILTWALRYQIISIHARIFLTSKNFWKALPHLWKDERSLKTVLVAVTTGETIPKLTRGFSRINNPMGWGPVTEEGVPPEDEHQKKALLRKQREEDSSGIAEQKLYTKEDSPIRVYSSLKRMAPDEEEGVAGPPPSHRCRLACPLPPPGYFPPEKVEFLPNYQPPSVRFATLQSVFLPEPGTKDSEKQEYRMKPREVRSKSTGTAPTSVDFPEFMPKSSKLRKNYLNLKVVKHQMQPPPPPLSTIEAEPKMKALLFDPSNMTLNFGVVRAPSKIFKDEVVVQVSYSGVSRSDLFLTQGKISCVHGPVIPGHEISGVVYAAGKDVGHVKIGDNVAINPYTACNVCKNCAMGHFSACLSEGLTNTLGVSKNGGWAEFIVVKKTQVHKVSDELGLDQAVLLMPLSCIICAFSKLKLSQATKILIQGLSLSGCLWASVLHSKGFKDVLVSDKNQNRRHQFEALNLDYVFIPPEDVKMYTVDVVIECTGSPTSIEKSFNILNPKGQMCFFRKPNPISEVRCIPYDIIQKEITIFGHAGNCFCFTEAIEFATSQAHRYLDLNKLGVEIFPMESFMEAFDLKKSGEVSKIVFNLDSDASGST